MLGYSGFFLCHVHVHVCVFFLGSECVYVLLFDLSVSTQFGLTVEEIGLKPPL